MAEASDAPELPDISEMVEAIRETVEAANAYQAEFGKQPFDTLPLAGKRFELALADLRSLLSDCDKALEAFAR